MPVLECSCGMVMSVSTCKAASFVHSLRRRNLHELFTRRTRDATIYRSRRSVVRRFPLTLGCSDELLQFDAPLLSPTIAGC